MNQQNKWYEGLPRFLPAIVIIGSGFASFVLTWDKVKKSEADIKLLQAESRNHADYSDIKNMDEKINKQYETQRTTTERIVAIEKWIEYKRGYDQAIKDYNIK